MTLFTMKIQKFPGKHEAGAVTWEPTALDQEWAMRNHSQTLQRLDERGGMSWCEMAAILEHRPHHTMNWVVAQNAVANNLNSRCSTRSTQRAAILRRHDTDDDFKVVLMVSGQSEDFDEGRATRTWLRPHLGTTHHLMGFADVETQEK